MSAKNYSSFIFRNKFIDLFFILIAGLIYAILSLGSINRSGIWFDEAFSSYLTNFNLAEITKYTALDVHPPFYYWILKIWTELFGSSELVLRSLSIVFGLASIVVAYLLIKKMFNNRVALLAIFFMAISPMLIRYGIEARMYTLVALISLSATYVLIDATRTNNRKKWYQYGGLVALGMWTHYFTAVIWLSHWVWRYWTLKVDKNIPKVTYKEYFSNNWIKAFGLAVLLYLPWLPFMAVQLGAIQITNFWIGPVSVNSFTNYLTNTFYYLEYSQVTNWLAAGLVAVVVLTVVGSIKVYKLLDNQKRINFSLLLSMSFIAPLILFIVSLPPLKPSFVERYLLVSSLSFLLVVAVIIYYLFINKKLYLVLSIFAVIMMLFVGVQNVYIYGNYNKNTSTAITTREVVREINKRSIGREPIIAGSPWIFYEAIPYSSNKNSVYFADQYTDYKFGSLAMLKESNTNKIKDIDNFIKDNNAFWYIDYSKDSELTAPYSGICPVERFEIVDSINSRSDYKAVKYQKCP